MNTSTLQFTNINGQAMDIARLKAAVPKKVRDTTQPATYHKGFRVVGIPPGALQEAQEAHALLVGMAQKAGGKPIKPFDPEGWRQTYRKKALRAKAYEVRSAADECASLAVKAGWLAVEVQGLTKQ